VSGIDLGHVERTVRAHFRRTGLAVEYQDRSNGEVLRLTPEAASARAGALPALLVAGEAVWQEATGQGFGLDILRDPRALLGYRVRSIGTDSAATVLLATMEATAQATHGRVVVLNDLSAVWLSAAARRDQAPRIAARRDRSPSP
jgi:hypothetical protein